MCIEFGIVIAIPQYFSELSLLLLASVGYHLHCQESQRHMYIHMINKAIHPGDFQWIKE